MEELTVEVPEIKDRINSSMMSLKNDFSNKKPENMQGENRSRERDIVRKGIRLEIREGDLSAHSGTDFKRAD